ncbi:MAG: hypothetical protein CMJ87_09455 [Planctomycetes bacterium]|jgi:uncharacterized membrane protein required for colicin V production|nr:hypothetical protein [Planctomycetota bacterium]MDP6519499.1 CvpA family protein [Planctomycetota bacterium]
MDPAPTGLAWIDTLGCGLLILLAIGGFWSGLWRQVMRTAGLVAAVLVPRAAAPLLAPRLGELLPDLSERSLTTVAWVVLFLVTLVLAGLLVSLGTKSLEVLHLRFLDRLLGSLVGLATGLVLHGVLLLILCQLAPPAWAHQTLEETHSLELLDVLARRAELILDEGSLELICPWLEPIPGRVR